MILDRSDQTAHLNSLSGAVPVRTVGEHAYRIKELRLRFYEGSAMYQPSAQVQHENGVEQP